MATGAEAERLAEARAGVPGRRFGPYLGERAGYPGPEDLLSPSNPGLLSYGDMR